MSTGQPVSAGTRTIRYDPSVVEDVVFHTISREEDRGGGRISRAYRRARDRCYATPDPDDRERAFRDLHDRFFDELGFREVIPEILEEHRGLADRLDGVFVHRVTARPDERGDLFVREGDPPRWTLVLKMCVETWILPDRLEAFLRHEVGHVHDMLDPAFRYEPDPDVPGESEARRRVARERFPILWGIRVDGWTERRGRPPLRSPSERERAFRRAFGEAAAPEALERITRDRTLTQADLLAAALDPRHLSGGVPEGEAGTPPPRDVHAPCPLCGLPSREWEESPGSLPDAVRARIRSRFPGWTARDGLCGRCAEVFAAAVRRSSLPGPIVGIDDHGSLEAPPAVIHDEGVTPA